MAWRRFLGFLMIADPEALQVPAAERVIKNDDLMFRTWTLAMLASVSGDRVAVLEFVAAVFRRNARALRGA
jgi:hypothetical protein